MSPRKLAFSNIAWDPAVDAEVAEVLRARGFSGVEIAPTKRWEKPLEADAMDIAEYRALWEARELPVVAMQALLFGRPDLQLFDSDASRQDLLDYLGRIMELGGALGARALVFGSPKNRARGNTSWARAMDIAVEFFRRAADVADRCGVVLCVEPNPPAYGCDFITTMPEAVELVRAVDHPCVRVQGDLGALTMNGEDVSAAIRLAGPYLAHFHASEPQLAEVGTGAADHVAAAAALRDAEYDGWISIEMRAISNGSDGAAQQAAVTRAAEFVGRVYG